MPDPDPTPSATGGRHVPAFLLAAPPGPGPVELGPGEEEHGLRVLRMRVGDPALGLDGQGGRWRLVVTAVERRRLVLEADGPREEEPPPGEPGAPLPWVEVAVAWPRKQRGEDMLGRLVQLGAAAVTPLAARHASTPPPPEPPERWGRLIREHAKQCGRLWLPELRPTASCEALADRIGPGATATATGNGAAVAFLEPGGSMGLDTWVRSLPLGPSLLGTRARPILLVVGPEGGFADDERRVLLDRGATSTRLGPHVLRVETAAEAALAITAVLTCGPDPAASDRARG